ncbi:MAG: hypothetical protein GY862_22565, partial [Gammaproteobacteria bacterium]|nr:hypothetical protein [Gammaproteobacteria bacterium]
MRSCPVCGKSRLAEDLPECPQCNADLECFSILDSLYEETGEQTVSEQAGPAPAELNPEPVISSASADLNLEPVISSASADLNPEPVVSSASADLNPEPIISPVPGVLLQKFRGTGKKPLVAGAFLSIFGAGMLFFVFQEEPVPLPAHGMETPQAPPVETLNTAFLESLPEKERETVEMPLPPAETRNTAPQHKTPPEKNKTQPKPGIIESEALKTLAGLRELAHDIGGQLQALEKRLSETTPRPIAVADEGEQAFLIHEAGKNETLWDVAEKHYRQGVFYPVLLEHNPGAGVYLGSEKLKVLKDRKKAQQLFDELVFTKNKRLFFRYKVNKEDSWEKISGRL